MDLKEIKNSFDEMSCEEQWAWLVHTELKDKFKIYLDNDDTFIYFIEDTKSDYCLRFKDDIGNRGGVNYLLEALGLNVQGV